MGNEFGAVEALWSQFEGVMAKDGEVDEGKDDKEQENEDGNEGDTVAEEK